MIKMYVCRPTESAAQADRPLAASIVSVTGIARTQSSSQNHITNFFTLSELGWGPPNRVDRVGLNRGGVWNPLPGGNRRPWY